MSQPFARCFVYLYVTCTSRGDNILTYEHMNYRERQSSRWRADDLLADSKLSADPVGGRLWSSDRQFSPLVRYYTNDHLYPNSLSQLRNRFAKAVLNIHSEYLLTSLSTNLKVLIAERRWMNLDLLPWTILLGYFLFQHSHGNQIKSNSNNLNRGAYRCNISHW